MGIVKANIPKIPKVFVCPAYVVLTPADPFFLIVPAQDTPQSAPYPAIQRLEGRPVAVLEVPEPSNARFVDVLDNGRHAPAIAPAGLASDGILEPVSYTHLRAHET